MPEPLQSRDVTGLDDDRLYAVLCYLMVLVLIPLLVKKNDPFVYFHARQGLVLLVGFILAFIAGYWLPLLGNLLFVILLIVDVIALVQAVQGRRWKIPVIGDIAQSFTI